MKIKTDDEKRHDADFDSYITSEIFRNLNNSDKLYLNVLGEQFKNRVHGLYPICYYFNINDLEQNSEKTNVYYMRLETAEQLKMHDHSINPKPNDQSKPIFVLNNENVYSYFQMDGVEKQLVADNLKTRSGETLWKNVKK